MSVYVLITGHINNLGGMDRANYALAWHLAERIGVEVHLVSHDVTSPLAEHQNVIWHRVPKPLNSIMLGEPLLSRYARKVASSLEGKDARVIVNGGICRWPDVNWVHAVHAAWPTRDDHAPFIFRMRNRLLKEKAKRAERRALGAAATIITNSIKARDQIVAYLSIPPERVHVVYLGVDADVFKPADRATRSAIRERLRLPVDRPIAAFVGALGHDRNKGFDVLFSAWERLCRSEKWNVDLVAAGGGAEVELWRRRAATAGLSSRIRLLGFTPVLEDILSAADLLVSPSQYESYGLAVHEAICCGVPALVSADAGIAERFPPELGDLLLQEPGSVPELIRRLERWHDRVEDYAAAVRPLSEEFRRFSWADMADQFLRIVNSECTTPC